MATPEPLHSCRVCRTRSMGEPLLSYEGMPHAAQNFPLADELAADQGTDLVIHECPDCGLVQLPGAPVSYYREVIRSAAFSEEMREFRQTQFDDWVRRYGLKGKRLLEVGCGRGEYLTLLNKAGVLAHGIEYGASSVAAGKAAGLEISQGFIDRPDQVVGAGLFDAFATFNFMEHWPDPIASLTGIRNNLAEEGLGLVEVPNFDMILRQGLYSEFISDHLCYFTQRTFVHALHGSGFEVLECSSIWHDYILSAVVKKRRRTDLASLRRTREAVRQSLVALLDRHPHKSVAVWGAGHQALATIALAGIGPRIKYVVDSAPFKQGRFTPATHIPIVAPDSLANDPAKAVIVMAAGYSDEVCRLIRADYSQEELPVAVLRDSGLEPC